MRNNKFGVLNISKLDLLFVFLRGSLFASSFVLTVIVGGMDVVVLGKAVILVQMGVHFACIPAKKSLLDRDLSKVHCLSLYLVLAILGIFFNFKLGLFLLVVTVHYAFVFTKNYLAYYKPELFVKVDAGMTLSIVCYYLIFDRLNFIVSEYDLYIVSVLVGSATMFSVVVGYMGLYTQIWRGLTENLFFGIKFYVSALRCFIDRALWAGLSFSMDMAALQIVTIGTAYIGLNYKLSTMAGLGYIATTYIIERYMVHLNDIGKDYSLVGIKEGFRYSLFFALVFLLVVYFAGGYSQGLYGLYFTFGYALSIGIGLGSLIERIIFQKRKKTVIVAYSLIVDVLAVVLGMYFKNLYLILLFSFLNKLINWGYFYILSKRERDL